MSEVHDAQGQAGAGASMSGKGEVIYGWDEHYILFVSVILSGWLPLTISLALAVSAMLWGHLPHWQAVSLGILAGLFAFILEFVVLWVITRRSARRLLVPLVRNIFKQ